MQSRSLQICIAFIVLTLFSVQCSEEPTAAISTLPTASIDYTLDPPGPDLSSTVPFLAQTNGGFTIMGMLYHNTVDLYDYASIVHIANPDWNNQLRIYWIPGNQYRILIRVNSLGLDCAEDVPTSVFPVHDAWNSFTWRYDASTQSFEFKSNSQTMTKTCSVGALQNFDIKRARTLNMNWAGMRVYDSVLSDDEMASELNKICVSADTCADVLTAGCDSAPACALTCLENTFASVNPASDAVVLFNPPSNGHTQTFTSTTTYNMGAAHFNIGTDGFTAVGKIDFGSASDYERAFCFRPNGDNACSGSNPKITLYRNLGGNSLYFGMWNGNSDGCFSIFGSLSSGTKHSIVVRYHPQTGLDMLFDGTRSGPHSCSYSFADLTYTQNEVGVQSFAGEIAGLYAFNRYLSDAEAKKFYGAYDVKERYLPKVHLQK